MRSRVNKRVKKTKSIPKIDIDIKINYRLIVKTLITILLYVILFLGFGSLWSKSMAIRNFGNSVNEFALKNSEVVFEIKDITFYTSASAKSSSQGFGLDISTFSDISFNIDNPTGRIIKSLTISNFNFDPAPELGEAKINYKNPYDFGKLENFDIESADEISFKVLDEETDIYINPIVYNNLASPITLTYVNKNILKNFQVKTNETSIYYDGRLLKTAGINISRLSTTLSFEVLIVTYEQERYKCKLYLEIPYETENSSVLDGNVLYVMHTDGTARFYQL